MRALHARVHDIRKRITQQEVVIELRVPIEFFAAVVEAFDDRNVLVVESKLEEPYGMQESQ